MSISDDEIRQAIAETFRVESDEHIQAMNRLLLRLEQGNVRDLPELLDEIELRLEEIDMVFLVFHQLFEEVLRNAVTDGIRVSGRFLVERPGVVFRNIKESQARSGAA